MRSLLAGAWQDHRESAAGLQGGVHRTLTLRCVTSPDEGQKVLLSRLGLTLPQRLRRVDDIAQM